MVGEHRRVEAEVTAGAATPGNGWMLLAPVTPLRQWLVLGSVLGGRWRGVGHRSGRTLGVRGQKPGQVEGATQRQLGWTREGAWSKGIEQSGGGRRGGALHGGALLYSHKRQWMVVAQAAGGSGGGSEAVGAVK
jgi:hypothetical protein